MKFRILAIAAMALAFCTHTLVAQTSAFTYQGKLSVNNAAANGTYDLKFQVFDNAAAGSQVGTDQIQTGMVISNGLFTTTLDFGSGVFPGADRWLQISAQTNGAGYTTLTPRQKVGAAPYSLQSAHATTADSATSATTAGSANSVTAANITGTVPDALLSTNVMLRNQPVNFTSFAGDGLGLTNLDLDSLQHVSVTDTIIQTNIYASAGTYNVTVPIGASRMTVKLWGAGGGGGAAGASPTSSNGGGGAYVQSKFLVNPGETYTVVVGQYGGSKIGGGAGTGGEGSNNGAGGVGSGAGHGGQASSFFKFIGSAYIMKAVAGAGGGAHSGNGGGGGKPGQDGSGFGNFNLGGGGGDNGYNYSINALTIGETNLNLMGGIGGNQTFSGAGGGGGYGGGGGSQNNGSGGGGGSYGDIVINASAPAPGNTNDPFYAFPAGYGGGGSYNDGTNGRVVVLFQYPVVQLAGGLSLDHGISGNGGGLTNVNASSGTGAFNGTFNGTGTINGTLSGTFSGSVTGTVAGSVSGTISGNGAGLTNLNAANISSGVANDSILSTNIPRLNGSPVFNTTVTASTFAGNGSGLTNVPWVIKWNVVSNTSQTAVGNNGYLLTNNALVTVTLPSSPNIGETIRIVGTGAAGWKLNQNAGQSIRASQIGGQFGVSWTPSVYSNGVFGIVSSADGTRLAGISGGVVTTSTDGGNTWVQRINTAEFVTTSADGTQLIAGTPDVNLFKSTNAGVSWNSLGQTGISFRSVCSSDNGTRLYAGTAGGNVYRSTDSGGTWVSTSVNGFGNIVGIACSADGTRVCAVVSGDSIWTSTNSGTNWTAGASSQSWNSVASSTDGLNLVAAGFGGQVYTSSNGGTNWTARLSSQNWSGVASSGDGSHLVAVVSSGLIYVSTDSGVNWTARDSSRSWNSVASSRDGSRLVAGTSANVYRSTPFWVSTTTVGTAGSLTTPQYSAIELQHIGGGVFLPLSFNGTFEVK
ncbi:MAG: hypothetical protein JWM68_5024 [Verrucomicrobiales bacterium]|nr:hypothetical protein [Verrucomicrobiales bacterium]